MMHIKAPGRCLRHYGSAAFHWGDFTNYLEVADDQFAVREVKIFENGNILRYDRSHWCDIYGMLSGLRFSRKPKWAVFFPNAQVITGADFEKVWSKARRSPLWKLQVNNSRVAEWGAWRQVRSG